jgi:hypothetical protein
MAIPYRESGEDRALTAHTRWCNGQRIDIRWSGGWLSPDGEYIPVDYANGVTHETLAEEHGSKIMASGSIMSRPPMMRLFDIVRWIRVTYLEPQTFCFELKNEWDDKRMRTAVRFASDFRNFDSYFINDEEHSTYFEFVRALRIGHISPKTPAFGPEEDDSPECHNNGPPCPVCRRPLRTSKAKQCFACGADWHE